MKKLGLIGGIGPESTLLYYRKIVLRLQEKVAINYLPSLTIESLSVFKVIEFCDRNDLSGLVDYLMCGIHNLINSGSEVIALTGNTPHIVFEELQKQSSVPLISIIEATLIEAKSKEYNRVGLIGTKATMQSNLFSNHYSNQNMDILVPNKDEQLFISKVIVEELEHGLVSINSQNQFIKIIQRMKNEEGIEAIILGCTELPLLVENIQIPVDILDTVEIHVNAIIEYLID